MFARKTSILRNIKNFLMYVKLWLVLKNRLDNNRKSSSNIAATCCKPKLFGTILYIAFITTNVVNYNRLWIKCVVIETGLNETNRVICRLTRYCVWQKMCCTMFVSLPEDSLHRKQNCREAWISFLF